MATSIASGALSPKVAVALSASLNLVGAFLSTAVAATIATGLVNQHLVTLELVFAGLVGGIVWNLLTWLGGIPSSSSHALIGGIIGSTLAAVGGHGVIWKHLVSDVIAPALVSPLIAGLVAATGTWVIYRVVRGVSDKRTNRAFRYGQIGSASLVSLAHGTNDAQKTMGVIFLALISYGAAKSSDGTPPVWVIFSCALAIAVGTYLGGWRVMRTLGKGLVEIESPQGMAAETSSAATILLSSHFGYPLSTTHVVTGSILGSGVGKPGAEVRWGVAGRMATAWLLTLPAAGGVGAVVYLIVTSSVASPVRQPVSCCWWPWLPRSGCGHTSRESTTRTSTTTGKATAASQPTTPGQKPPRPPSHNTITTTRQPLPRRRQPSKVEDRGGTAPVS
jgi:inorganic phosphate transporter, PiT family